MFVLQCVVLITMLCPVIEVSLILKSSVSLVEGDWLICFIASLIVTVATGFSFCKEHKYLRWVILAAKIIFIFTYVTFIIVYTDTKDYYSGQGADISITLFGWFYIIANAALIICMYYYSYTCAKKKRQQSIQNNQYDNDINENDDDY